MIFVRGLPSVGKTLVGSFLKNSYDYHVIDPDNVNLLCLIFYLFTSRNVFDIFFYKSLRTLKYRYNLKKAISILHHGKKVVWTQMFSSAQGLSYTIRVIHKSIDIPPSIIVISLVCPDNILLDRSRDKTWLSPELLKKYRERWQNIPASQFDQGLCRTVTLSSHRNSAYLIEDIRKLLTN